MTRKRQLPAKSLEQLVCQELIAAGFTPYYWTDTNAAHELDFIIRLADKAVPIEVKAGTNLTAASLKYAMKKFNPPSAIRHPLLVSCPASRRHHLRFAAIRSKYGKQV